MLNVFCAVTSTRTPSVDDRDCLNSTSVYKSRDLLEEAKADSDWLPTERLPDRQAADMIWSIDRVVFIYDVVFVILPTTKIAN